MENQEIDSREIFVADRATPSAILKEGSFGESLKHNWCNGVCKHVTAFEVSDPVQAIQYCLISNIY